ncbi:MAG: PKD domain-containing protein [Solirubrobacteraceae bacterium]
MSRHCRAVVLAALLALTATATTTVSASANAAARHKTFGGVIADLPTAGQLHRSPLARIAAGLPYGGGPVLHANRTHVIFWQPAGSGLSYDPGYQLLVETFLANVAADSRKPTNPYGLSGQYRDSVGPATYASTFGGSVTAADPLPANGCAEPPPPPLGTGPGWSVCLNDSQLEAEIAHVAGVYRLPRTANDVYFLVTPNGMGSCEGVGPDNCALGGDSPGSYCGYHSTNNDQTLIYAVIPYNALPGHCQSVNPRPNASTADPVLSTISHEHSEVVTDPLGSAWIDGSGNENGDLCISSYGPVLNGLGPGAFNQVIHGGHYYLQNEYSNEDHSCQPRDEADLVTFRVPARVTVGRPFRVSGRASDPDGSIVRYDWYFGQGRPGRHRTVSHTYTRASTYRILLRTTDTAGNWSFLATRVKAGRPPRKASRRS